VLINREPLPHLKPDVELLGNCDAIVNQLCSMLDQGGQDWTDPVHAGILRQIDDLPPLPEPDQPSGEEEPPSSPSWQPKQRVSMSSRLPANTFLFVPPNRYVFPGAEVFENDDDDDDEMSSSSCSSSVNGDDQPDRTESDLNDSADQPSAAETHPLLEATHQVGPSSIQGSSHSTTVATAAEAESTKSSEVTQGQHTSALALVEPSAMIPADDGQVEVPVTAVDAPIVAVDAPVVAAGFVVQSQPPPPPPSLN
jgi:hypothetical protein